MTPESPEALLKKLERRGELLVRKLLAQNVDHVVTEHEAVQRFGGAGGELKDAVAEGRVIAFVRSASSARVYPAEQFRPDGGVWDWPALVVRAVGNGGAALHLLYVPRKSLSGKSLAEVLRSVDCDAGSRAVGQIIRGLGAD